ncbi:MAG TPA: hypothetical protein VNV42_01915 [Solirubrobacteraceae bacterium]|jgi:hypothetical protein|nr:hypothetical protein [Solirubrobacteraceae bacterium]
MTHLRNTAAAAIAVIAAAAFLPGPARASGSVVLWACHGPHGEALGAAPFVPTASREGRADTYERGCEGPAGTGGLAATFSSSDPEGGSVASWRLYVPAGVTLDSVRIARSTTGFDGTSVSGDPQVYEAATSSGEVVEHAALDEPGRDQPLSGELVAPSVAGHYVSVSVSCALLGGESCTAPPSGTVGVDVSSLALGVLDEAPPTGAVEGVRGPVEPGESMQLLLYANDTGLGLANAEASIDGHTVAFVRLGAGACPEHPSSSGTLELPLGATGCPESVSKVPLSVPVGGVGSHQLRVSVTDAAGNRTTLVDETIVVESAPPPSLNTVTIGIGSQGSPSSSPVAEGVLGSSSSGAPGSASGGVLGYSSSGAPVACYRPMLTMKLVSKPLRYARVGKRRVPVLLARRHYLYRGALTCLLNNHRVSAPTGTVVHVLDKVGRRILKSGRRTITVHKGALRAILGYTSARTIIFRYGPIGGELVQVKLPIEIGREREKTTTQGRARRKKKGRAAR